MRLARRRIYVPAHERATLHKTFCIRRSAVLLYFVLLYYIGTTQICYDALLRRPVVTYGTSTCPELVRS